MSHHHKRILADLSGKVAERHNRGLVLLAEARSASDMATVQAKLAEAMPLLTDTNASMEAIVQTATVMATGEMPDVAPQEPVQADTLVDGADTAADAEKAASGQSVVTEGEPSAEDEVATGRRKR